MTATITNTIPVPPLTPRTNLRDMLPGDSFRVPDDRARSVRTMASALNRKDIGRWVVRQHTLDDGGREFRCWRVE